jgi:putative ATPase
VREHGAAEPPPYLQDAHYPGAKKLGRGEGYRYPHDEPGGVTDQPLAPESVRDERFYEPTDRGFEAELAERIESLRERRRSQD